MLSRDIRLTANQLIVARDAVARRRRELEKRLEKTSYDGKPNMLASVLDELKELKELERVFEHNREQLARHFAEHVLNVG